MTDAIRPHPYAFTDSALSDLRERMARTRWPERETVDDWSQGAPLARMQSLCDYWRDGYDWRAAEARLNALDPSMTQIDGLDIHFLHLRSPCSYAIRRTNISAEWQMRRRPNSRTFLSRV